MLTFHFVCNKMDFQGLKMALKMIFLQNLIKMLRNNNHLKMFENGGCCFAPELLNWANVWKEWKTSVSYQGIFLILVVGYKCHKYHYLRSRLKYTVSVKEPSWNFLGPNPQTERITFQLHHKLCTYFCTIIILCYFQKFVWSAKL